MIEQENGKFNDLFCENKWRICLYGRQALCLSFMLPIESNGKCDVPKKGNGRIQHGIPDVG